MKCGHAKHNEPCYAWEAFYLGHRLTAGQAQMSLHRLPVKETGKKPTILDNDLRVREYCNKLTGRIPYARDLREQLGLQRNDSKYTLHGHTPYARTDV
jgi:hypothetical protein